MRWTRLQRTISDEPVSRDVQGNRSQIIRWITWLRSDEELWCRGVASVDTTALDYPTWLVKRHTVLKVFAVSERSCSHCMIGQASVHWTQRRFPRRSRHFPPCQGCTWVPTASLGVVDGTVSKQFWSQFYTKSMGRAWAWAKNQRVHPAQTYRPNILQNFTDVLFSCKKQRR